MYAVFAIKPDESTRDLITMALSLLLLTKPEKIQLISRPDAREIKRLKKHLRPISSEYITDSISLYKIPTRHQVQNTLAVIQTIPGFTCLIPDQLKYADFEPLILHASKFAHARRLRNEIELYKENLSYFFFKTLFCSHFALTQQEQNAFSSAENLPIEEQRALAESYYQRVVSTYLDEIPA